MHSGEAFRHGLADKPLCHARAWTGSVGILSLAHCVLLVLIGRCLHAVLQKVKLPMQERSNTDQESAGPFSCACEACVRDGLHEPNCGVHLAPPQECGCGRTEQSKGAG